MLGSLVKFIAAIWAHETYGPIAHHLVRQATAALIRHVRTKTKTKTWQRIS